MFCPRCRKFTDDPLPAASSGAESESASPDAKPRRRVLRGLRPARALNNSQHCSVCGTLLTFNRLADEFPALSDDAAAGGVKLDPASSPSEADADTVMQGSADSPQAAASDKPVTVQDILRATAGPNPISGVGQIPLDQRQPGAGDRREQGGPSGRRRGNDDFPLTGSRYQASETARRRNEERRLREMDADWRHSDSPRIPRGFGRKPWRSPNIEAILGLGTLVAVALLIVSMAVRLIFAPNGLYMPAAHPTAQIVRASTLGYVPPKLEAAIPAASAPHDSFSATPASLGQGWSRIGQPISLAANDALAPAGGERMDFASYNDSSPSGGAAPGPVRVWVQRLRSSADALTCLTLLAHQHQELLAGQAGSQGAFTARWETIAGQRTVVFDMPAGQNEIALATPGEVALGFVRSWQHGSRLITVAAADAASRDRFVRDYLAIAP